MCNNKKQMIFGTRQVAESVSSALMKLKWNGGHPERIMWGHNAVVSPTKKISLKAGPLYLAAIDADCRCFLM